MVTLASNSKVIQNIGLFDRVLRLLIGGALVGVAYHLHTNTGLALPTWGGAYVIAVALYPIFTGMLGWDPFYAMFSGGSCSSSGRNQCGTLPFQMMAMAGHAPGYCDTDAEHSLEACHTGPAEHPHHKVWRVDPEPMLYPDEKAWHQFMTRKQKKEKRS